jgi:hypothetical protein
VSLRPPPVVQMTHAELRALPEYSCSLPTGTRVGKRWVRNNNFGRPSVKLEILGIEFVVPWPPDWWQGQYVELDPPDPKRVGIRWSKVALAEEAS